MDPEDLYGLAPEQFTAARDAAAKRVRADGDRDGAAALKALRRPTVSAWLLNALVRDDPALVEQLLRLGPGLAQAQAGGDAAGLRALGEQRRQLVGAVVDRAVAIAGRPVTAALRDEVAATMEAALADPASADAVRSGRLVRALSYAGFGSVDLADAVAPAGAERAGGAAPQRRAGAQEAPDPRAERLAEAEAVALEAAGRLDDAARACRDAEQARTAAARTEQERAAEVERLEPLLAAAKAAHDSAAAEASAAGKAARKAGKRLERAQDRAEQARAALDHLRRDERS